jgi:hypothetical protein
MQKLLVILCSSAIATCAFAQGLINFRNTSATLISSGDSVNPAHLITFLDNMKFGLLISSSRTGPFTFSGVYTMNNGPEGTISAQSAFVLGGNGGAPIGVPNWAAGTTMFYEVVGWSEDLGFPFNNSWLTTPPAFGYAVSGIGSGVAGGGPQSLPPLDLFGGPTGIASGFFIPSIPVPEPSSMALAALAGAILLIFRRQPQPNHSTATNPAITSRCHAEHELRRFVDRNRYA